jgi:hypothetical protein
MGNSARLQRDSLIRFDNGRLLMAREPESFERVLDWTEGKMNELEPAKSTQWLWFGTVLLSS